MESLSRPRRDLLDSLDCLFAGKEEKGGEGRVKIVRGWHGTTMERAKSIMVSGFASLARLDDGWFGKGIYFTTFPEYLF